MELVRSAKMFPFLKIKLINKFIIFLKLKYIHKLKFYNILFYKYCNTEFLPEKKGAFLLENLSRTRSARTIEYKITNVFECFAPH